MSDVHKRAIFVCAEKGGVGKTTFSRGLLHLYRTAGLQTAAYDTDSRVGSLMQYYGTRDENGKLVAEQDPFTGVGYFDLRTPAERDGLIDAFVTGGDIVLMDLPGGAVGELEEVLGDGQALFEAYAENGYDVIVVFLLSKDAKVATRTIGQVINTFSDTAKYIAVKNLGIGVPVDPDEDFKPFDGGDEDDVHYDGTARKLLEQHGGEVITMPALQAETRKALDNKNFTFEEGMANLSPGHYYRIRVWLDHLLAQVNRSTLLRFVEQPRA